jgi:hypothetical protein
VVVLVVTDKEDKQKGAEPFQFPSDIQTLLSDTVKLYPTKQLYVAVLKYVKPETDTIPFAGFDRAPQLTTPHNGTEPFQFPSERHVLST